MNQEDYDQHFMIDEKLISRIIDYANLDETDIVLEIGPGKGVLTKELIKQSRVIAIELDLDLCEQLEKKIKSDNLKLIQGNALDLIDTLAFDKIVANIPYSISEPLLKKILTYQPNLIVLCTGQNFDRYLRSNNLFNLIYNYKLKETVSKTSFNPPPRTESIIFTAELKHDDLALFFRDLCKQYDKKVKNALIKMLEGKFTKNQVREKIKGLDFVDKSILSISAENIRKIKMLFF